MFSIVKTFLPCFDVFMNRWKKFCLWIEIDEYANEPIYSINCELENPKISYVFNKTLVLSITCSK